MFKLQPNPTFKARVELSIPGEATPASIEVEFRHLSKSAMRDYFATLAARTDADALGEIVVGWSGVDAPFDRGALATLVDNYPAAAGELFEAFRREAIEGRRKN